LADHTFLLKKKPTEIRKLLSATMAKDNINT
jgi:hypothetical protein